MRRSDFKPLYDEHAGRLFAFFLYRTADRGLSEDLVADTFERAIRARRRFDPSRGSERTWLYSIGLNCLRDHLRRDRVQRDAASDLRDRAPEGGAEISEEVERRSMLRQALAQLSPEERDAISLRFGADLTVKEIAELSGESFTTAQGRVYRALRKLRDLLEPAGASDRDRSGSRERRKSIP